MASPAMHDSLLVCVEMFRKLEVVEMAEVHGRGEEG